MRIALLISICIFCTHIAQAQNLWVMEVTVSGNVTSCVATTGHSNMTGSFSGPTGSGGGSGASAAHFTVTFSTGEISGTVFGSGSETCNCDRGDGHPASGCTTVSGSGSGSMTVDHHETDGEGCYFRSVGFSGTNFSGGISIQIYKKIDPLTLPGVNSANGGCTDFTLTAPATLSSYFWEFNDNPANPGNWVGFSKPGLNQHDITVTKADLSNPAFTGNKRFVRVTDGACDKRISSPSLPFFIPLAPPSRATVTWGSIDCFGGNGSVTVTKPLGLTAHYAYFLDFFEVSTNQYHTIYSKSGVPNNDNTVTTIDQSVLSVPPPNDNIRAGKYRVRVANDDAASNSGACEIMFENTFVDPPELVPTINNVDYHSFGVKCNGDMNGSITADASGGTGTLTYSWSPVSSASKTITGLGPGTYTVTVRDSKNCTKQISKTLIEPSQITGSISVDKAPLCNDSNDGQLSLTTSGGAGGNTFSWSSGSTGTIAQNLVGGTYTATITDQNGCQLPLSKLLSAPAAIDFSLMPSPPNCAGGTDGSMTVTNVQNAAGLISYAWTNGETGSQISNVRAGHYSVTVSSPNGAKTCATTKSNDIIDPTPWTATIVPRQQYNGAAISCSDQHDGQLDVVVKNDLGQVATGNMYEWSTGDKGPSQTSVSGLGEDTYDVTVTYNGTCKAVSSFSLMAPDPVDVKITPDTNFHGQVLSCHNQKDGAITATARFGTGAPASFNYLWDNGETTRSITGLKAGTYNITVKDLNQCIGTASLEIINPDSVIADVLSFSDYSGFGVTCKGKKDGSITTSGVGGTSVYSYAWSNGATTPSISDLLPGDYTVSVTDNNGCSSSATHTITEPDLLAVDVLNKKDVSCFEGDDGSITLLATGGASQYQYSLDNTTWQAMAEFDGLSINTYTLNVRDANGCKANIAQELIQPSKLQIDFSGIEPAFCADPRGKATGIVTGGVPDYRYEWRNNGNSTVLSTTNQLSNIPAGIYDLSIKDAHDCPAIASVPITSTDGAKTTYASEDAKCFDSLDGSAEVKITEGDGPFVIKWPDNQNTFTGINLKRGNYNVLITDVHDCTVVQQVTVNAPNALQLNVKSLTIPTCNTFCDGSITLEALGGVGNYSYTWNDQSTDQQNNLCAKVYPVVLKDANGCVLNKDIELKQPDPISIAIVKEILPTCNDGCDGSLEVMASGGNSGYSYMWTAGSATSIINNICPASYDVKVTDVKGCIGKATVALHNTPKPPFSLGGGATLCVGQKYTLDAGTQWKSVKWGSNTGLTSSQQSIVISTDGSYWVDVISNKGCLAQDTFLLQTSRSLLKAEFFMASTASVGDTLVMIDVSWPLPETIEWSFPDAMRKLLDEDGVVYGQYDVAGSYDVALTAHLGECVDTMKKTVTIIQEIGNTADGRLGYDSFVKSFILHPNPNDGKFNVSAEFEDKTHIIISVWNASDLKLVGKIADDGKSSYLKQLDLRPLPAGNYLIRLDHDRGKEYIRFIIY